MSTVRGWSLYEELKRGAAYGWHSFMAMPFNKPNVDEMLPHIRQAVKETGFVLRRIDDDPKAGLIDDQLRVEIQAARFLIADLTYDNNGAYWEAGYAERSEEHTSELQSLMRISYAVFCLKTNKKK